MPPPRLPPSPVRWRKWTWIAAGGCAAAVLALTRLHGLYQANLEALRRANPPPDPSTLLPSLTSREHFLQAVVGKSRDDIRDAFGEPARMDDGGRRWVYQYRTVFSNGGRIFIDGQTTVMFDDDGPAIMVVFPDKPVDREP